MLSQKHVISFPFIFSSLLVSVPQVLLAVLRGYSQQGLHAKPNSGPLCHTCTLFTPFRHQASPDSLPSCFRLQVTYDQGGTEPQEDASCLMTKSQLGEAEAS